MILWSSNVSVNTGFILFEFSAMQPNLHTMSHFTSLSVLVCACVCVSVCVCVCAHVYIVCLDLTFVGSQHPFCPFFADLNQVMS